MLQTLPNTVLDAVVERAGFGHGWRLEIASPSLRAASRECAARRLGKCRWVGGDRAGTEFKPCWRHVAVAMRSGRYLLSFSGGVLHPESSYHPEETSPMTIEWGSGYMTFQNWEGPGLVSGTTDERGEASKFVIEPAPNLPGFTANGGPEGAGGIIHEVDVDEPGQLAIWNPSALPAGDGHVATPFLDCTRGRWLESHATWWLLHLETHVSHLPFCWGMHCRGPVPDPWGRGPDPWGPARALQAGCGSDDLDVESWELVPATLAADERFEFEKMPRRVN